MFPLFTSLDCFSVYRCQVGNWKSSFLSLHSSKFERQLLSACSLVVLEFEHDTL
ncbi:hypothetical protein RDI58_014685 [Solanum bulbocastanum]|uniref:Uncharacterized protein n=1 Tax=Solanum bulbocastanum TaxID=147425 RepID=A0AAN8YAT2_SOLBU